MQYFVLFFMSLVWDAAWAGSTMESISAQGLLGSHFGVPGVDAVYDYVIIGGGTAGLTVARRLAAKVSNTVAVIEAGDFYEFANGNRSEIPAFATDFTGSNPSQKNPYLDWYQYTEPQPDVGDESYSFNKLLPYFQRSASFHPPDSTQRPHNATAQYNSSDWSSTGGPLQVGYSSWVNPVSSWLGLALEELGLKELPSLLSGKLLGWSWLSLTLDPVSQTRSSSEVFLREALRESTNLMVYKSTLAKKITFADKSATGVIADSGGITYKLSARKEVILCAGVETFPDDWPHIEYLVLDAYFGAGSDSSITAGSGDQYVAASIGLVATFSRGNVTINSTDTAANPVINPNWLSDPRDQDVAIAAFRRGRRLFSTSAMKPIVKAEAFPGPNITTDAQILDTIKKSVNSVYNAAGTNKMGKQSDPKAVVDNKGRVFGVGNLRVVDASVFPFLPPGQPSATVCECRSKDARKL
ncbi:MAG: hypothetical protein Q9181_004049 [Wetmoreana brouardii]